MTIDQLEEILREFDRNFRYVQRNKFIHGIQAVTEGEQVKVEILIAPDAKEKAEVASLGLPKRFSFTASFGEANVEIMPVVRSLPKPSAAIGSQAFGLGLAGAGTLGWNIQLDGQNVCVSNWHVFCTNGNATAGGGNNPAALGLDIFLNGVLEARVLDFVPLRRDGDNNWDLAFGEYINVADWVQTVRACPTGGPTHTYPTQLTPAGSLRPGSAETYWTVGNRAPICQSGTLRGVAQFRIVGPYDDGNNYRFNDQLVFSWMSCGGDSGSIVVHDATNTVTGLIFAGDANNGCTAGTESLANPLYKAPWTYKGLSYVPETKSHIPVFESSSAFRAILKPSRMPTPLVEIPDHDRDVAALRTLAESHAQLSGLGEDERTAELRQSFVTGMSVLGFAIQRKKRKGPFANSPSWYQEAPEGTREQILVRVEPLFSDEMLLYYLCLGNRAAGRPIQAIGTFSRPAPNRWQVSNPELVHDESGITGKKFKGWSFHGTDLIVGSVGDTGPHWVLGETVQDRFGRVLRQPLITAGMVTSSYPVLEEFEYQYSSRGGEWVRKTITSITMTGTVPQQP